MTRLTTSLKIQKGSEMSMLQQNIWGPSLFNWRDVLEDFLYISRKRFNNKWSMVKIQVELFQDIINCQKAIMMYKDVLENPSNIKKYSKSGIAADSINPVNIKKQINTENILIKSLKEVADGHLWRIFNYNRSLIYLMGIQSQPGHLTLDSGTYNELSAWGDSILDTDISHFILNELTNSARIGDVILKRYNGNIEVKEIKSSSLRSGAKQKTRLDRQQRRRTNFESLANTGKGEIKGAKGEIFSVPISYKASLRTLRKILTKAEEKGISGKRIGNYLSMICVDRGHNIKEDRIKKFFKKYKQKRKNKKDIIIYIDTSVRNRYSPNYTPFSIFPISEKFIADLLLGKKQIFYSVNVSEIFRAFKRRHWVVVSDFTQSSGESSIENTPFCTVQKNQINIDVPWTIPNQITFDLLDINSIISLFDYTYRQHSKDRIRLVINYNNENQIWK